MCEEDVRTSDEILSIKEIKESYLVIDFKRVIKPIINEEEKQPKYEVSKIRSKERKQSRKTESFMEYYNSVSKKSSTNILEKYIKTKR